MDVYRTSEKVYYDTLNEYLNDPEIQHAMKSVRYNTHMTALRVSDTIDESDMYEILETVLDMYTEMDEIHLVMEFVLDEIKLIDFIYVKFKVEWDSVVSQCNR